VGFAIVKHPLPFPSDPAWPSNISWSIIEPDGSQREGEPGLATARWYRIKGPVPGQRPLMTIVFKKTDIELPADVEISHLGWVG
jgi:hypothetical protein